MRRASLLFALVFALGGCAVGSNDAPEIGSPSTTARGRPAVVVTTTTAPTTTPANGTTPTTAASAAVTSTTVAAPISVVHAGRVDDPAGDAGLGASTYADLRAVDISARGDSLVVTVTFAGPIPARMPDGEVEGVGVDLFSSDPPKRESDWQVFADGETDGWYGYLDGPDGPVILPGTLTIDGPTLTFELSWAEVGDPASGSFSAFVDWTREGVPLDTVTSDHAPDRARADFRRP